MRGRWQSVLVGLVVGSTVGCLLELDLGLACGDGHHDPRYEECDPADPASFEQSCAEDEVPTCDIQTCELHCGSCGDGRLDDGEACDGNGVRTLPSCQQWSCVGCQVVCPRCGNGQVDSGEECDVGFDVVSNEPHPIRCNDIPVPGRPDETYVSDAPVSCRSDCSWDRSGCNLCGNEALDDAIIDPNNGATLTAAERCDGEAFDLLARFSRCESVCGRTGTDCTAECGAGCLSIDVDAGDPGCCIRPGFTRAAPIPCCCELPLGDAPGYCTDIFDPPIGGRPGEGVCPG